MRGTLLALTLLMGGCCAGGTGAPVGFADADPSSIRVTRLGSGADSATLEFDADAREELAACLAQTRAIDPAAVELEGRDAEYHVTFRDSQGEEYTWHWVEPTDLIRGDQRARNDCLHDLVQWNDPESDQYPSD
jgi:hypothetical protein